MDAVKLRNLLLAGIGLVIILTGVTVYYASTFLHDETVKSIHAQIDADVSGQDLDRLKSLEKTLDDNQDSVRKAEQIVAATKQYQYQDQIINDINRYAQQTGVEVTAYNFTPAATGKATTAPTVAGVKTISVALTLKSPLPFDNYLRFVKAIEQNLTKMQISGVNITPDPTDVNGVVNPSIGLVVYVR